MSAFLSMLKDFFTSKKVLTAIGTTVATLAIKDPATRDRVVAIGGMLLAAQGATDFGKAAKTPTEP